MKPYFDVENLKKIQEGYDRVDGQYKDLLLKYTRFKFSNDEAKEYATQGLMRRIRTLYRCIFNVFEITPPQNMKPLTDELSADLSINLQSFVLNVFGSLDNVAWIWVKENSLDFNRSEVGLKPKYKKLRNTFSPQFKAYLSKFDDWFQYLENYRDALAHMRLRNQHGFRPTQISFFDLGHLYAQLADKRVDVDMIVAGILFFNDRGRMYGRAQDCLRHDRFSFKFIVRPLRLYFDNLGIAFLWFIVFLFLAH